MFWHQLFGADSVVDQERGLIAFHRIGDVFQTLVHYPTKNRHKCNISIQYKNLQTFYLTLTNTRKLTDLLVALLRLCSVSVTHRFSVYLSHGCAECLEWGTTRRESTKLSNAWCPPSARTSESGPGGRRGSTPIPYRRRSPPWRPWPHRHT